MVGCSHGLHTADSTFAPHHLISAALLRISKRNSWPLGVRRCMQSAATLRALLKQGAAVMAAFASSGVAAPAVSRSTQRTAVCLQRLLPQASDATPRLPLHQFGRLSFTTLPTTRRQLCSVAAVHGRRDMSAHAAAVRPLPHDACSATCCCSFVSEVACQPPSLLC